MLDDKLTQPSFTAEMEGKLDSIANGQHTYLGVLQDYFAYLEPLVGRGKTVHIPVSVKHDCDKPFVVKVDKGGAPYFWCSKCKEWVWCDLVNDHDYVLYEEHDLNENCSTCGTPLRLVVGKWGPYPLCKSCKPSR